MRRLSALLRREWLNLILGTVVAATLLNGIFASRGLRDLMILREHRSILERQREQLEADNQTLRTNVQKLKSDDSYVERLVRSELGYVRPGEIVFRFSGGSVDTNGH